MNVLVLYGGSRRESNSDLLTNRVVEGIPHTKVFLYDTHIEPIIDMRHAESGFLPVDDDYDRIIHQVLAHDILIFGTPIYWYSMPAKLKLFFDRWSQSLRDKQLLFKAEMAKKQAYVVLTGGDQPRIKGLPTIQQFQYIFGYFNMPFAGYVIGEADRPRSILADERALNDARAMNAALRSKVATT